MPPETTIARNRAVLDQKGVVARPLKNRCNVLPPKRRNS